MSFTPLIVRFFLFKVRQPEENREILSIKQNLQGEAIIFENSRLKSDCKLNWISILKNSSNESEKRLHVSIYSYGDAIL
jgi:hypothetical protein